MLRQGATEGINQDGWRPSRTEAEGLASHIFLLNSLAEALWPSHVPVCPCCPQSSPASSIPKALITSPSQQGRPPYAASAEEVAKELKSKSGESKSSAVSSEGSLAENGVMAEEKPLPQLNGSTGETRAPSHSESALNNDSKTCNTNPHLNALSTDSACRREAALEAAVLNKEE